MTTTELAPIVQRLDALSAQIAQVIERQRARDELFDEMSPIAREVLATAIARLDALDKQGYFAFASELARVGRRVVEGFSPDDVRQLGDAIVGIIDAVRALTHPEVLRVATEAGAAVREADRVKPVGMFGAMRATRDDDVQKGLGLLIDVLRRVGHGVAAASEARDEQLDRKARLAELLGPRRARRLAAPEPPRLAAPASAAALPAPPAAPAAPAVDGVALRADGHLADASAWSRPVAEALAAQQHVALTDAHWALIDAARADFEANRASPNIQRLTQIAQVTTKDLYRLFPKAPARTIAKLAGLPKPAGCL